MSLERRWAALVTGGSRGIGAATALALATYGYDVALSYRNRQARADRVAAGFAHPLRHIVAVRLRVAP